MHNVRLRLVRHSKRIKRVGAFLLGSTPSSEAWARRVTCALVSSIAQLLEWLLIYLGGEELTMEHITGINAAVFTAFRSDGSVNLGVIERQADSIARNGLAGVFVCGTTGEGMSMTVAERQQVAERWIEVAQHRLNVIVHVGSNILAESQALTTHAQSIGAKAIAAISPSFFKPSQTTDLVAFCSEVAAAAPELPFFYYHIPSMTGVNIAVQEFFTLARERIPSLAGAKFTYDDMNDLDACCRMTRPDGKSYNLLIGRDESLLDALQLGAQGAIGSTYNYIAPLHMQLLAARQRNDLTAAQAAQEQVRAIAGVVNRFVGIPAGKAMMQMLGLDVGAPRLPLHTLDASERHNLEQDLRGVGFFDVCSVV